MSTLEWIAILQLEDGKLHTFRQPSSDPVDGFERVLEAEKKGQLVSFFLEHTERQKALGVNLKTGKFIFSFIFHFHPAPEIVKNISNPTYRLINFRRKYRDKGTGGYASGIVLSHYILGWQTTIREKNHQRMMFINAETLEVTIKEKR